MCADIGADSSSENSGESSEDVLKKRALMTIQALQKETSKRKANAEATQKFWNMAEKAVRNETEFGHDIKWALKLRRADWGPKQLERLANVQRTLRGVELGLISTGLPDSDSETEAMKGADSAQEEEWIELQDRKKHKAQQR